MNKYLQKTTDFQEKLKEYANCIFRTYGKELVLRLEEYNLLQNKHNCIESSTAIGFVLEEFLVSKLEMFTHCTDDSEYVVDRFNGATASESYDCYSVRDNIKFLVNVKAEKSGSSGNTAIAAIEQLHRNYCNDDGEYQKCFILFKIHYSIHDAYEDDAHRRAKPRHIHIDDLSSYSLETVDLSGVWYQDNRQWSVKEDGQKTKNNGRLKVSLAFRKKHVVQNEDVSYKNTCNQIDIIWHKNEQCWLNNDDLLKMLSSKPGTEMKFVNYSGFYNEQIEHTLSVSPTGSIEVKKEGNTSTYTEPDFKEAFKDHLWKGLCSRKD